ncbi:MAG: hypothetical protein WBI82_08480 [Sphaerochaeta sp.]
MQTYDTLFTHATIGSRIAKNRFVSQPMEGNDANEGKVSPRTLQRYKKLAQGNWGIIIVEALSINANSLARKNQLVLNESTLPSFKNLIAEMKTIDPDTLILLQITHSGRKSGKDFSHPTALYAPKPDEHLLTTEEIQQIQNEFIHAVLLAEQTGADGVDFKLCHGYLGCEFLRPANIREDKWGGSLENRTRFFREAIIAIRKELTSDTFILGSRISYYEGIRGGCGTATPDDPVEDLEEMDAVISMMAELNFDYINVSAGIPGVTSEITRPTSTSKWFYLHQFRYARRTRRFAGSMKVIGSAFSVLQEDSLAAGVENIERGDIDFVGWGRQTLADPLFPKKVLLQESVDYCKLCSGCSRLMVKQEPVRCIMFLR